jgi:4-aminobutyrate aminotransferase-like enzyme/aminoglycoside phosphotransferase (APT) family kinase protein
MSIVKSLPPSLTEDEVRQIVKEYYGFSVTAQTLVGDISQNFYLRDDSGRGFVFKIANPEEKWEMLDCQNKAMEYLQRNNKRINCPQPIPAGSREQIVTISDPKKNNYHARMLTYLEGEFLAEIEQPDSELLYDLGCFLGSLDKTLAAFEHPSAHRYWHWDITNTANIKDYLQHIGNPSKRRLVDYFLLQYETWVSPKLPGLRKSIIHNDANDYNVLIKNNSKERLKIAGIIDFGDIVFSCTICELAVALAYVMFEKEDPLERASHVIRGYHEEYQIHELELDVLYYLICARLCMSVTISAYQQNLRPDEAYLAVSEKSAWELLETLLHINPIRAAKIFRQACKMPEKSIPGMDSKTVLSDRKAYVGKSLSIAYQKPLRIIGGAFQYLYDDIGRSFLDAVNNVPHVGHCHPRVVRAAQQQMAILNTNTRYLHDNLTEYAKGLTAKLPNPLSVCFFVNSGSEANEIALRMAKIHTKQSDFIVVDNAYHGNTSALIDISPYKFDGPGGNGKPPNVQKVTMPDTFRGPYKANEMDAGQKYAHHVQEAVETIQNSNRGVAAFVCESLMGCAGQIIFPDGYLKSAYKFVQDAGGLCIADEVQVGFGRVGSHFWAFETQGVVPDIITLGKPIGNGHPLGAVVTTPEIADSFNNGMEFFSTFGGNPVSCAVGLAVLDVIEEEKLQDNAKIVGAYLKNCLEKLKSKYTLVGDVRGLGLFIGVELVLNRETLEPATQQARNIIERMKNRGILTSTDGPFNNVLKIKPPMVFNMANADFFVNTLEDIIKQVHLQV